MADRKIRRLIPYELFEIDAIEGWLDEQARQGLRLTRIGGRWAYFEKPESPTMTRYRIDVKRTWGYDTERQNTFRELGWEFVDGLDNHMDVYRAFRPGAVEINTDEEALQGVLGRYYRRNVLLAAFTIAFLLVLMWIIWGRVTEAGGLCTALLGSMGRTLPIAAAFFLYGLFLGIFDLLLPLRARRRSQTDREYHSPPLARRRILLRWIVIAVMLGVQLCNLFFPHLGRIREITPLSESDDVPIPALEEICPDWRGQETYLTKVKEPFSLCRFAWVSGASDESARPYYSVRLFDARWSSLANGAALEQISGQEALSVAGSGWDSGWFFEKPESGDSKQHLILLNGSRLMLIEYIGDERLTDRLELFAQK